MTASPDSHSPVSARDQALAWFVRINSGDALRASDRAAFAQWLAADPSHRREYQRLDGVWRDLDRLPDPRAAAMSSRRHFLVRAGAAMAVMAVAGVTIVAAGSDPAATRRTAIGRRDTLFAGDGSRIDLDAGSAVAIDITPVSRRVRVLEGRAMFAVTRDPDCPFAVSCADGTVRTPGAVFTVHKRRSDVMVSVQEKAVELDWGGDRISLDSARKATYGGGGLHFGGAAGQGDTAWLRGRLVFEDQPLGDVVAELERYRPGRVLLWDAPLENIRVSGVFDTERPEAALAAIVSTLPVRRLDPTPWLTILRHA